LGGGGDGSGNICGGIGIGGANGVMRHHG